jgi:hypothetical protein
MYRDTPACPLKQEFFYCIADVSNFMGLESPAGLRARGGGTMGAKVTRHATSRISSRRLRLNCMNVLLICCVQQWIILAQHREVTDCTSGALPFAQLGCA